MTNSKFDRKAHWDKVYSSRPVEKTSWHQDEPRLSLDFITNSGIEPAAPLIDIGGGASTLIACLLDRGFSDITVLDISGAALDQARVRLGKRAAKVNWIVADVTEFKTHHVCHLWHDRAVFHFLVDATDRKRYIEKLNSCLQQGGSLVISAFSKDGPSKCSGLEIVQYDAQGLGNELGPNFQLREEAREIHITPAGGQQKFGFYRYLKVA